MNRKKPDHRRAEQLVERFLALRCFHNDATPITTEEFRIFVDNLSSAQVHEFGISTNIVNLAIKKLREEHLG